jgi:hypothetical protein
MDQDETQSDGAARAFNDLRAEISLLRRATERLTDERADLPDYAPSLEVIGRRLEDVCAWAKHTNEKPAMKLTPESLAREIVSAAGDSRNQDHRLLEQAISAMDAVGSRIDATVARKQLVHEQNLELKRNRIAFFVAGIVLWSILPGAVARSLPVSWAVPERIAARMLGLNPWDAGQDMMAKANPDLSRQVVASQSKKTSPAVNKGIATTRH